MFSDVRALLGRGRSNDARANKTGKRFSSDAQRRHAGVAWMILTGVSVADSTPIVSIRTSFNLDRAVDGSTDAYADKTGIGFCLLATMAT